MAEALSLQRRLAAQSDGPTRPTVTDLVIRAAAMAPREAPALNASCQDNQTVLHDDINIGLVIGLPERMMIPAIKQADTRDLNGLAATTKWLRDQALAGTLAQTDLTQGAFTISNLGCSASRASLP
jgi:pyruvate/2-oxoglutarate dehydrogenase complex dihydrolipoamide acyltransferase (E2) component